MHHVVHFFPNSAWLPSRKRPVLLRDMSRYVLHVSHVAMGAGKSCLKMKTRHTAHIFDKEQNIKKGKEN